MQIFFHFINLTSFIKNDFGILEFSSLPASWTQSKYVDIVESNIIASHESYKPEIRHLCTFIYNSSLVLTYWASKTKKNLLFYSLCFVVLNVNRESYNLFFHRMQSTRAVAKVHMCTRTMETCLNKNNKGISLKKIKRYMFKEKITMWIFQKSHSFKNNTTNISKGS